MPEVFSFRRLLHDRNKAALPQRLRAKAEMIPVKPYPVRSNFGLLPEPERSTGAFFTSAVVNCLILVVILYIGATAKRAIDQHRYQETMLIMPAKEPPPPPKVKMPPPPPMPEPAKIPEMKFEAPKISVPKPEPKPEPKPVQMEAKLVAPAFKTAKPQVILSAQPKAALAGAAMPAQDKNVKFSTKPVHFGDTFGVTPNPNAKGPATVAAIGNPYGGMQGPAIEPHGKVGSAGFGNGSRIGSSAGVVGKVASAGVPGGAASNPGPAANRGRVAAAGVPTAPTAVAEIPRAVNVQPPTPPEVSIPKPTYTDEARNLKIQGNVILRVTFFANGQIKVVGLVQGLGHGLDEQARLAVQRGRVLRPATRNGQAVDMTTNITITFQLA
jgi:TonB family protein